jgi:hypothetical protein
MDQAVPPTTARPQLQQIKTYAVWFLLGLLIGVVPLGVRLFQAQRDRETLHQQLQVAQLEMHLASAALMARHGDYTAARDSASQFFTAARQASEDPDAVLSPAQRSHLQTVLTERDALISLLSRGDPAAAERSTAMYVAHRAAFPR